MEVANWSGSVWKKAFKTATKDSWKNRWLIFDAAAFSLKWADSEAKPDAVRGVFALDPHDLEYTPCEDHRKPFEMKVSSRGQTLYFRTKSAEEQNVLLQRLDAARRAKVASVESNGTVFRSEDAVVAMGSSVAPGEPGAKVFSWGVGMLLGINNPAINGMSVPQRVAAFRSEPAILALSCGPEHAAGVTADASAMLWGSNEFYQLAQAQDMPNSLRPLPVALLIGKRVLQVACGGSHSLASVAEPGSSAGQLYAWGTGTVGQLGLGSSVQILDAPSRVELPGLPAGTPVSSVYAGLVSSGCIAGSGEAFMWGDASVGRLGLPGIVDTPPTNASGLPSFVNASIAWTPTRLAIAPSAVGVPEGTPVRVVGMALGGAFSLFLVWVGAGHPGCVLLASGALGVDITRDTYGYPPRDDTEAQIDEEVRRVPRYQTPSPVMPFYTRPMVLGVYAGARHAAAVVADDRRNGAPRLYTAGKGWLGHAGALDSILLEKPTVSPAFVAVAGQLAEEDVVDAGCGHSHTLARTADGRLFAWGRGDSGELGHGNLSDRSMPVQLRPIPGHVWTAVAGGSYYSAGIATAGYIARQAPEAVAASLKARWTAVADQQAGTGGSGAGAAAVGANALAALAHRVATAKWDDGGGELPPGWDYDTTPEGEYYYIRPDGETQWDDPRTDFDSYVKEFLTAAKERGVDLNKL